MVLLENLMGREHWFAVPQLGIDIAALARTRHDEDPHYDWISCIKHAKKIGAKPMRFSDMMILGAKYPEVAREFCDFLPESNYHTFMGGSVGFYSSRFKGNGRCDLDFNLCGMNFRVKDELADSFHKHLGMINLDNYSFGNIMRENFPTKIVKVKDFSRIEKIIVPEQFSAVYIGENNSLDVLPREDKNLIKYGHELSLIIDRKSFGALTLHLFGHENPDIMLRSSADVFLIYRNRERW